MDKLTQLLTRCKCGVYLAVNEHRVMYETAAEKLQDLAAMGSPPELTDKVRTKIIETNTLVDLQFYPDTPVGFYRIVHHDVDAALTAALACLKAQKYLIIVEEKPTNENP